MEEKVKNRGGKRENAGRKKRDKGVKPILLNIELDLFEAFKNKSNKTTFINDAIRFALKEADLFSKFTLELEERRKRENEKKKQERKEKKGSSQNN